MDSKSRKPRTGGSTMTAQPADRIPASGPDTGSYEVIHLGGQAAVVVPVSDFLRLRALEQAASPQELQDAEDKLTSPSGLGWPVRHGLGLFLGDLLQVRLPVRLVLLQSPGDCRVLLLSDLRFGLGPLGLCPFGLCLGPCLRVSPCGLRRRVGSGMFAHDSLLASTAVHHLRLRSGR